MTETSAEPQPIPVTILTGFLGAGKTTLLNYILHAAHGHRIAVIENEFGPVNIDSELLVRQSAGVIEMTNGCLCCTVRADLARHLLDLKARRDAGELHFDRVMIETTGVADPGPVVQTFFGEPTLREAFLLDAVVTVVDVVHAPRQLQEQPVLQKQIGFADRLLLSKVDLVEPEALSAIADRLAAINPRAPMRPLEHGQVDLDFILDIRGFNLNETLLAEDALPPSGKLKYRPVAAKDVSFRTTQGDEIGSILLEHPGEVDLDRIGAFVQDAIDRHGDNLLRYKGVLAVPGQENKLIFQGIHRLAGFDFGEAWGAGEARRSRIVVIGLQLPVDELRAGFAGCLLPPAG